jgi:hypothetical protein
MPKRLSLYLHWLLLRRSLLGRLLQLLRLRPLPITSNATSITTSKASNSQTYAKADSQANPSSYPQTYAKADSQTNPSTANATAGLIRLQFRYLHPKHQGYRCFSYACRLQDLLPHSGANSQTYAKAYSQANPTAATASTRVHVRLQDTYVQTRSAWWKQ